MRLGLLLRAFKVDNSQFLSKIGRHSFNPYILLVIRLSRTGKKKQATYRLVVAEHTYPVQGKFVEILGSYNPGEGKKLVFDGDRITYWISKGAKPSDTVAGLLHAKGVKDMEKYMDPKNKKRAVKNPKEVAEPAPAPAPEAAPAEEAPVEAPVEEAAAPEAKAETVEETPAEEPAKEEAAPEEAPTEEAPAAE